MVQHLFYFVLIFPAFSLAFVEHYRRLLDLVAAFNFALFYFQWIYMSHTNVT